MKVNKNKGMYLESVLNNSIDYYRIHKIALIRKQTTPVKITRVINQEVVGKLSTKCDVDYYGIYNGYFIAIEAKQTKEKYFERSNILEHQLEFLKQILEFNGLSYLIVYFQQSDSFYFIEYKKFEKKVFGKNKKTNRIQEKWFQDNCFKLELMFPGRLDFVKFIKVTQTKKL